MSSGGKRQVAKDGSVSPPPSRKRKLTSATTNDAVNSFFKPASQKNTSAGIMTWAVIESTLLVGHFQPKESSEGAPRCKRRKIAAFDFDGTLVKSASGKVVSRGADDWMWWHPSVPKRLRQLDDDGYQIVIISNQGGVNLSKNSKTAKIDLKRLEDFKAKIVASLKQLDLSVSFFAATDFDRYRKPRTGVWFELLEHFELDGPTDSVDKDSSFFVGDAGGRLGDQSAKKDADSVIKDFASSDLDFASNIGIKFLTPDEYFLNKAPRPFKRSFEPHNYIEDNKEYVPFVRTNPQDIVCISGSPGAGKSTFYWKNLAPLGYERVNQDQLKTRDRCLKQAIEYLESGKSVAVDNTNADPETRAHWIELAKRHYIPIRCIVIKSDPKLCEHNDAVRALNGPLMNPENRSRLPFLAFAGFAKRFREPSLNEGFQDVTIVQFRFVGTKEQEAVWTQYYV